MASKMVTNRQGLGDALNAAALSHSNEVSPALERFVQPYLQEGESLPDFGLVQQLLGRMLTDQHDKMVAADKAHIDEMTNDAGPRERRDAAVEQLRQTLLKIRSVMDGVFGVSRRGRLLPVNGAVATAPRILWRQAEHALERLRNPPADLPTTELDGIEMDYSVFAAELEPAVAALRSAMDEVALQQRNFESTRGSKVNAMARFDVLFTAVTDILQGLYNLADLPHLAERVRPTVIRRRRKKEELENEAGGEQASEDQASVDQASGDQASDGDASTPPASSPLTGEDAAA